LIEFYPGFILETARYSDILTLGGKIKPNLEFFIRKYSKIYTRNTAALEEASKFA